MGHRLPTNPSPTPAAPRCRPAQAQEALNVLIHVQRRGDQLCTWRACTCGHSVCLGLRHLVFVRHTESSTFSRALAGQHIQSSTVNPEHSAPGSQSSGFHPSPSVQPFLKLSYHVRQSVQHIPSQAQPAQPQARSAPGPEPIQDISVSSQCTFSALIPAGSDQRTNSKRLGPMHSFRQAQTSALVPADSEQRTQFTCTHTSSTLSTATQSRTRAAGLSTVGQFTGQIQQANQRCSWLVNCLRDQCYDTGPKGSKPVTGQLQACDKPATSLLQACDKPATGQLQACDRPATSLLQACYKPATSLRQASDKPATSLRQASDKPATSLRQASDKPATSTPSPAHLAKRGAGGRQPCKQLLQPQRRQGDRPRLLVDRVVELLDALFNL
eukprot:365829-Chlamydomonas_euryale.AAC.5